MQPCLVFPSPFLQPNAGRQTTLLPTGRAAPRSFPSYTSASCLDRMSLFPFPKTPPVLDTARRRGPPTPLRLGAAYQKKVLRGHQKFVEPQALTHRTYPLIDSACDFVFRGAADDGGWRRAGSGCDESWESRSAYPVPKAPFSMLDECQTECGGDSTDGDHAHWTGSERGSLASSTTSDSSAHSSSRVDAGHDHRLPQHSPTSLLLSAMSAISYPAECRIGQGGQRNYRPARSSAASSSSFARLPGR